MALGTLLPTRIPLSPGPDVDVSAMSMATLISTLGSCAYGSDLDGHGATFNYANQSGSSEVPDQFTCWGSTRDGAGTVTTLRNCNFVHAMPHIRGKWFRLLNCTMTGNNPWGVRIEGPAENVEVDGVTITNCVRSGFMCTFGAKGYQLWNSKVLDNGASDGFGAYGVYAESFNDECVVANCLFQRPERWALHAYSGQDPGLGFPMDGLIFTCNTLIHRINGGYGPGGFHDKGGAIVTSASTNLLMVGCIVVESPTGIVECYQDLADGNRIVGCIDFNATGPTYQLANMDPDTLLTSDPELDVNFRPSTTSPAIDLVPVTYEGYVPTTDHEGVARATADAGYLVAGPPAEPSEDCGPDETVSWEYDGATDITATITNAAIGQTYSLNYLTCSAGAGDTQVAATSTVVLAVTGWVPAVDATTIDAFVTHDDTSDFVGAAVFEVGNTAETTTPVIAWDLLGATVTADFQTVNGVNYLLDVIDIATGQQTNSITGDGSIMQIAVVTGTPYEGQYFYAYVGNQDTGNSPLGNRLFLDCADGIGFEGNPGGGGDQPVPVPPAPPVGGCGGGSPWDVQAGRFYEAPPWRSLVTTLDTETLTTMDHLASNRTVTTLLDQPCTASGRVPSDNPEINRLADDGDPLLAEGNRFLYMLRREATGELPWVVRFAGIIMQLTDDADPDRPGTTYTAMDPWQYLYRRPVRRLNGTLPKQSGAKFNEPLEDVIRNLLLRTIDEDGTTYIDAGEDWGGTEFYTGTVESLSNFKGTFEQGMSVGEAWTLLTETGDCDIVLEPIYDPVNRPGFLSQLSIYERVGTQRNAAIFSYDMPGRSLIGLRRTIDGTVRANRVQFYAGQGGPAVPLASDALSSSRYGEYWYQQFWPISNDKDVVALLAEEKVILQGVGLNVLTLDPTAERSPIPFLEYGLGDVVPIYASSRMRARIGGQVGGPVIRQRVHGIPIELSDNQLETVRSLIVQQEPEE